MDCFRNYGLWLDSQQLDYMKKNGKPHTFVNCDEGGCDGMDAFPTLKGPNGETSVGYTEM